MGAYIYLKGATLKMNHLVTKATGDTYGTATAKGCRLAGVLALLAGCFLLNPADALSVEALLQMEKSIVIPNIPVGPYSDHMEIDADGGRLFVTPQAAKALAVVDLKTGHVLKMIPVGNPHDVYFDPMLKRLFVTDGATGSVLVFSTLDYSEIKRIPLLLGTDGLVFDPQTRLLYVNNGGEHAKMDHAVISVVNVERMEKLADISVATRGGLEAAAIDSARQVLYVNDFDNAVVAVVDLKSRKQVATWKLPEGVHGNIAAAIDAAHSRLYVASRDSLMHGSAVVLDTHDGHVIARLPVGPWTDGIFLDHKRHRFYVSSGGGHVDIYTIGDNDAYRHELSVETALLAKTSLYSSELDRLFVSVPQLDDTEAQVMVFKPSP